MEPHRRILVIDDEENVLLVLQDALIKLGEQYEVVTAQEGCEALDKVRAQPFDLVITDLKGLTSQDCRCGGSDILRVAPRV